MDDIRKHKYLLSYQLQFFAEGADKTEEPTSKKLKDARSEGQAARSKELTTASGLAAFFLVLKLFIGFIGNKLLETFHSSFSNISKIVADDITPTLIQGVFKDVILTIITICIPIFIAGMGVAFVVVLFQVKWEISGKPMRPKFNKINPVSGFKRVFSKEKIVELIVDTVKIVIICYIAYNTLKDEWKTLFLLYDISLIQAILLIGELVIDLGLNISIIFLVIGFADLIYQKIKFKKDMRMSKQEVKDEYKQQEGDPLLKSKIKSKMRVASQRRMMQAIPQADVVITIPTLLAAAMKYNKDSAEAPVLLAKGADFLAMKIKDIARENNIVIVENKPLARMLYYNVELGEQIPPELYQMTAEVLAYVYGLK